MLTHLEQLEAQAIYILREVIAEFEKPVLMYSIGKDSAVLLHLLRKACAPAKPMMPLLHIDTTWKFKAMYELRDAIKSKGDVQLMVHTNQEGLAAGLSPFGANAAQYTDVMKTGALLQALQNGGYDAAVGGARRDEEVSRAKERIFSFRNQAQVWDPKQQRPELWSVYNTKIARGESVRVFPLSNWTEQDVWQYIRQEGIEVVPLYFAAVRPVVNRNGVLIMQDDDRLVLKPGEKIEHKKVRFRTLGCYPLSGAIESDAETLDAIIDEMQHSRSSERQGRLIDRDGAGAMERKKREGYF
jgi:sulfate adenylyltransferase subunit 2